MFFCKKRNVSYGTRNIITDLLSHFLALPKSKMGKTQPKIHTILVLEFDTFALKIAKYIQTSAIDFQAFIQNIPKTSTGQLEI